jgi:hypothetical protein
MKITNKRDMYALYQAGAFGNKLKTWAFPDFFVQVSLSIMASTFKDKWQNKTFSMRYAGPQGGGWAAYNATTEEVLKNACDWVSQGADKRFIQVNESAPDDRLVIQGEVQRGLMGLDLTYSTEKTKMRLAMANPSHAVGLRASLLLQHYMTPDDWEDLNLLLDTYEDAVVEFSTYEMELGDCPHRRTVFWEVRSY